MQNNLPEHYPFYKWVPKPLGIIFMILLFIPILTIGGVYTANSTEMVGGLGIISEHITFVNFCTSVGMAAFCPFLYRLVCIRREKLMMLSGLSIMFALSYICAVTESIFVLALCSVIMGFLRMVLMLAHLFVLIRYAFGIEATQNLTPGMEPVDGVGWDKLDKERAMAQPAVYFFFMLLGQLGTSLTAWLSFEYEWQYVYHFMMATSIISILIIFISMPFRGYQKNEPYPINLKQFGNVAVFCITWACFSYVLVYGKVLDWYDDPTIQIATIVGIVSAILMIYMDVYHEGPYFKLGLLRYRTVWIGIILYFLLMFFNSSAMFVNVFASIGMKLDNWQSASLNNWTILGYFIGMVIAIIMVKKGLHLKYVFAAGFLFIAFAAMFMYFEVQSAGLYERMKYPVIIRSCGMMMLYALATVYATQRIPFRYFSTWICVMITIRMVVGPVSGASAYTNVLQHRQQHYVTRYAQNVDVVNIDAASTYNRTLMGMQYQGKSEKEAHNMAALSTKGRVQVQATLSAVKEMAGWTIWGCAACALLVLVIPYPKRDISNDYKGESA